MGIFLAVLLIVAIVLAGVGGPRLRYLGVLLLLANLALYIIVYVAHLTIS